ncbi:MAG TPA: hypothetical protein VGN12_00805 [Pirellulales bacterium]|jgi:hypothetical protein
MSVFKRLSLLSAVAVVTVAAVYSQAGAAQQSGNSSTQARPRTAQQTAAQRRNYRAYSYEPSRGGDVGPRASADSWKRADSKVKFRYGYYPY